MTDYEVEYQNHESACGEPFVEIENFFSNSAQLKLEVLDLGCGQGRDALTAARYGHRVVGVDIAPTGIRQMREKAAALGLDVVGKIADLCSFRSPVKYDVVILDRVVHMLVPLEAKIQLLETAANSTKAGGQVLLVDTPKNLPIIDRYFESFVEWELFFRKKGFRFYRKAENAA